NSVVDGVPFIITQSTTYTVTGTNTTTGCSATDEVVVTVNPIPQPVISTIDNLNICSGDDINVEFTSSIPGAVSQWFKNDVMIDGANQTSYTATEIGTYSLEVTEKGCSGLSNKLDIIELDRPEPIISTNDKVQYDFGETISTLFMVSVNDAESYQWLMNGTPILDANQPTFTATQVGVYSVELLVNGCTGISNTLEIIQSQDFNPVISTTDNLEWCEGQSILVNLWVNIANADKYVWYRNSEIITNASTANIQVEEDGIYKVDVTVNEVTKTSTKIEIVTIPAPNPTISTNDKLVWPEGNPISVTFTADITDAEAYQWLNGATPIPDAISASYEATTVGEYSVLVTKGSCQGQSNVIEVTTAPYFNVTFTVKNTGGEPMSNAEITVENFDPIVTNEAGVAIFISTEGMFNYMVKAQDFNSFEDAFTVNDQDIDVNIVMVPSGISEEGFLSVNLYPNPFKNEIKISDSGLLKRVVITSISGQKVMDVNLEGINRINTQNLPAGVYLLKLYTQNGESKVFRMVKDQQ
ncbi:MAG: T9SS type A sorting domain-containing protein, partial [Tenuifilaceae bacterium]|nr:T9SS type A sorting domain-containing protein [Tenuifilaceae bacterium]